MEIDELGLELNVHVGQYDTPGIDDRPTQSAFLNYPLGIIYRKPSIYIAEHPNDPQGRSILVLQYSLRNPKAFRTFEPFKFSNARFFYPYKQWENFRTRPSFVR